MRHGTTEAAPAFNGSWTAQAPGNPWSGPLPDQVRDARPEADRDPTRTAPRSESRRIGLLVVDDETAVCQALAQGLEQEGFAVWQAIGARRALDVYRARQAEIELVLLDVCMPELDGPRTLAELRRQGGRFGCCFMTGHLGNWTERTLEQRGAARVFFKPFTPAQVAPFLRQLADQTRAARG